MNFKSHLLSGLAILTLLVLFSCNTEEQINPDIIKKLGIDESSITYKYNDIAVEKTASKHFASIEEAKQFIKNSSIRGTYSFSLKKDSFNDAFYLCTDGIATIRKTVGLTTYLITFNVKDGTASSIKSELAGFTLGVSWTHLSSSSRTLGNNEISITANALQHYNLVVEGIGTVYSQEVTLKGTYNPCTGKGTLTIE